MDVTDPIVYIFNSHQTESFRLPRNEVHNIRPNVMMASFLFKERLNNYGVPAIVEENNFVEYLRRNNLAFARSYDASRHYLNIAKRENPTLKFFVDIHRDAIRREAATITIDGKTHARILFVVGLEHENYQANLREAVRLNRMINERFPGLSRGIMQKAGPRVNGVYNQDVSRFAKLIEIGSHTNYFEEIYNTINIIAPIYAEYVRGIINEDR